MTGASGRPLISRDGGSDLERHQYHADRPGAGLRGLQQLAAGRTTTCVYFSSEGRDPGVVHVVKTTDRGKTWSAADHGLPDAAVSELAVDARDASGRTLRRHRPRRLLDPGWRQQLVAVRCRAAKSRCGACTSPEGRFMRIATYGRGVWEVDLP